MLGPMLLAFVARIETDHPRVLPHEQWLAAGGALSNFLTAVGTASRALHPRHDDNPDAIFRRWQPSNCQSHLSPREES